MIQGININRHFILGNAAAYKSGSYGSSREFTKIGRFSLQTGECHGNMLKGGKWRNLRAWRLLVCGGHGAGYIGGWTFYIARNCASRHWEHHGNLVPWQIGFTKNANVVPYVQDCDDRLVRHAINFGLHEPRREK